MRTRKSNGRLVAQLRKIIGKSQSQLAAMIGVSKHTIISVENRRNELSRKLARRIEIATGIDLLREELKSYTAEKFDEWRKKYHPGTEASALEQFEVMKDYLKVVLLAATKPGLAGNRDRFASVCFSLVEWLVETRQKFKLGREIDGLLEDETHYIGRNAFEISLLLEDPNEAKKLLGVHGIDFSTIKNQLKSHAVDDWLVVEDEFRRVWDPSYPHSVVCKTRNLVKKAKYWVKALPPNPRLSDLHKLIREPAPPNALL